MKKNFSVLVIATIALFSFYLVKSEASSVAYEWGVNKVTSRSASSFVYSSNAGEALYTQHTSYAYYGKTLNTKSASANDSTNGYAIANTLHPVNYNVVEIDGMHKFAGTTKYTNKIFE